MRAYWAVVSARFRALLQYRAAALAGLATQVFWGLLRVMIFQGFYASSTVSQPMTLRDVITYVWLGQATLRIIPMRADADVAAMFRSGTVAYELLKPVDLYWFWYSRALANMTAPTLLRAVPMIVLALLLLGMQPPASVPAAAAWAVSTLSAVLLSAAISTLLCVSLFWTVSGEGVNHMVLALGWLFGGIVLPIPLFPDWAQPVLAALPFRGLMDIPFRLYLGHIPPSHVLGALGHQLAWTAALVALGRLIVARATRRLVVQGG